MSNRPAARGLLTPRQASRLYELSNREVARLYDQGYLAGFKLPGGKHRRIRRDSLDALCREHGIPVRGG